MARPSDPEDKLPSYEESIADLAGDSSDSKVPSTYSSSSSGQRILDKLTLVRAQHVRSIVDDQIYPLLERQTMYGIAKTTFALIPSNAASSDSETSNAVEVIGLPSDEQAEQVRLEGHLNRIEFWRQPEVVHELQRVLQERLFTSPLFPDLRNGSGNGSPPAEAAQRKSLFGRKSSSAASEAPRSTVWKPEFTCGRVTVQVKLEEIYLRTMSEFGLYETVGRPAVVVRVDLRC